MPDATALALPPVPRDVTPLVHRRAWTEPTVRFWWLLAATVLLISPVAAWAQVQHWRQMKKFAAQPPTRAVVLQGGTENLAGRPVSREAIDSGALTRVRVGAPENGYEARGDLLGWDARPAPLIGDTIEVRLDPADPTRFAVVYRVPTLLASLTPGLVTIALALAPLAAAWVARNGVLQAWQFGEARTAVKRERRQTALSPGSVAIRCNWADSHRSGSLADRAVFTIYVPRGADEDGDASVIVLDGKSKRVAAAWFARVAAENRTEPVPASVQN